MITIAKSVETISDQFELIGNQPVLQPEFVPAAGNESQTTCTVEFDSVKDKLCDRPLTRPNRTRPIRELTNEQLKRIATTNRPPPEWFVDEEERPF